MEVLDLCCCSGGATRGYQLKGHRVTGVDLDRRSAYCGDSFIQMDAVEYALAYGHLYDFIHASPPCQFFCTSTPEDRRDLYPNLIPSLREALTASGVPFVIENVVQAVKKGPMRADLKLCGEMFGLRVIRHRVFEFGNGFHAEQPKHVAHKGKTRGAGRRSRGTYSAEGYYCGVYGTGADRGSVKEWQDAMGIDWMTERHDLAEAIPPAYSAYLASFLK